MALRTTVIGSFPKPDYVNLPDWFKTGLGETANDATKAFTALLANQSSEDKEKREADIMRATEEAITLQTCCGVNVVSDGEIRRENYIHYLCRFIEGIDFCRLSQTSVRNGAYKTELPTIRTKLSWRGPLDVVAEWKKAQELSEVPVKYTLPGPMTIIGTLYDDFYKNEKDLASDLAEIINYHVRALAHGGCKCIQVDEPLFARQPEKALDWGIPMLDKCFEGVGEDCEKVMHMCCGYPNHLDMENYLKADPSSYFQLAEAIDNSCIDAVSIEDAHRHNDLTLLYKFKRTTVILGVVKVASSVVETPEEIEERLREALEYIDAERLVVAPDCGLALLPMPILKEKLTNMCIAAKACTVANRCGCGKRIPALSDCSTATGSSIDVQLDKDRSDSASTSPSPRSLHAEE